MKRRAIGGALVVVALAPFAVACVIDLSPRPKHAQATGAEAGAPAIVSAIPSATPTTSTPTSTPTPTATPSATPTPP